MNLMGTWITGYWNGNGLVPGDRLRLLRVPDHRRGRRRRRWSVRSTASSPPPAPRTPRAPCSCSPSSPKPEVADRVGDRPGRPAARTSTPTRAQLNEVIQKALDVVAASPTYNFNYDLATPPAPSEVGLDMFQKFMADPAQDVAALLAETQTAVKAAFEQPVDQSARPPALTDRGEQLHDADAGVGLGAIPASAPEPPDYHLSQGDMRTRADRERDARHDPGQPPLAGPHGCRAHWRSTPSSCCWPLAQSLSYQHLEVERPRRTRRSSAWTTTPGRSATRSSSARSATRPSGSSSPSRCRLSLGLLLAVLLDRPLRGQSLLQVGLLPAHHALAGGRRAGLDLDLPARLGAAEHRPRGRRPGGTSRGPGWETRRPSLIAVIVAWCWQQTALSLILYLAALTTVPAELLEAAAIDGANAWQQFRRIIVPLLRPSRAWWSSRWRSSTRSRASTSSSC